MKGKLFKTGNDYLLKDTNGEVLAITNGVTEGKKLSKQNCDEIFGVVYVEKLADEYANVNGDYDEHYGHIGFKEGFKKAIELNKDKVFTLDDMYDAVMLGVCFEDSGIQGISTYEELKELAIKRALKPTEIDVEVEVFRSDDIILVEKDWYKIGEPKLDPNGFLILKKI